MNLRKKKGFTIVELVIVIAVIGILAAVLIPTFVGLVNKANISADNSLVRDLNNALAIDSVEHGKHNTMADALSVTDEYGFNVSRINAKANKSEILWDSVNDVFCYFDGNEIKYIPEAPQKDVTLSHQYFVIRDVKTQNDISNQYSTYLRSCELNSLITSKGIDVGDVIISQITYQNSANQDVIIRTNSSNTSLIIDDLSTGTIKHYGSTGELNIIECHTGSYHEFGKVAFAEIAKGRIVLEGSSDIEQIHINSNESKTGFEEVIIADNGTQNLPETITRDAVTVSATTTVVKVVSVSGEEEIVSVYAAGTTGTTEKTATQNVSVDSLLGQLVLDNGSNAGEKARTEEQKSEDKTELVNEAKAPEIAKNYEEETSAVVYNLATNIHYDNLYDAISAVPDSTKQTLVLLKNITGTSNKNYEISANKIIVLDLNGHIINTVAPDESTAWTIINKGTLTIKDNTDTSKNGSGTGKITSSAIKPDMQDIPGYASNTITNNGKLTIESGIIENRGSGYACFAIDNQTNGTLYSPELIINGGKMLQESQYHYAVRMFANSTSNVNKAVINGGVIEGGYAFWLQYPNANANKAELTINGGIFIAYDGFSLYSGNPGKDVSNVKINITGGEFRGTGVRLSASTPHASISVSGGKFNGFDIGTGETSKFISGGTFNSKVISTWGYVYITDNVVYVENQDGSKGEAYEAPFDSKSYWESQGYTFDYDSSYGDYVVKVETSMSEKLGGYIDENFEIQNGIDNTITIVSK